MARPLPKRPRTRVEEILRARGHNQAWLIDQTGWSQSHVNRVVQGRSGLSSASSTMLARVLDCPPSALHGDIGEPIPARRRRWETPETVTERLAALASLYTTDWDALLRFLLAGDYSGLPVALADRLRALVNEGGDGSPS